MIYNDVTPPKRRGSAHHPQTLQAVSSQTAAAQGNNVQQPQKTKPKKGFAHEGWRSILTTVAILVTAPLLALLLTQYVFQTYQVDGPSMEPTLQQSDRLIVWKTPRTWAQITGNSFIPNRGDVVVFTESELGQFGQEPNKQLIKRVVALPGERVVVKDGTVTVYNSDNPEGFMPDDAMEYGQVIGSTPGDVDTIVPENHVFVLGDNRVNSLDSRSFGSVKADNIVGELEFRVLPIDEARRF